MTDNEVSRFIDLLGYPIEYYWTRPPKKGETVIIMLHEGLGSLSTWQNFPRSLSDKTRFPILVYSRHGYGRSEIIEGSRGKNYMHNEALRILPALLEELSISDPVLLGHSDGASISLIHAGSGKWAVRALILEAAHVFVEEETLVGIRAIREAYIKGDLKRSLARYHDDPDKSFYGWNDLWLNPDFRDWNIESYLEMVDCPILLLQGENDEYGTKHQINKITNKVRGSVDVRVIPSCGHSPHRDHPKLVLDIMSKFIREL
ncbi:MAG: alpha/beta hydrolase [Alphaproteobacteria bacterium]|nr:alpha/beta hydrolase [Alphaproteobacteria bacterium]PPR14664.1 MAG: 2-succinyl-6-hydroxy-2,4-cyclohexadiene-1-carboxylate synthase [Alphaproteobacteria bacterium MarineAlpha12_Bin1]|tara:strand:+ start:2326 stop:3105 length:780 start_codon:yes stop_codon:yes gene_type:complete